MTTHIFQKELHALREQFAELQRWSQAAADELQDFINHADEAGQPNALPSCQSLLDEHSDIMKRFFGK